MVNLQSTARYLLSLLQLLCVGSCGRDANLQCEQKTSFIVVTTAVSFASQHCKCTTAAVQAYHFFAQTVRESAIKFSLFFSQFVDTLHSGRRI